MFIHRFSDLIRRKLVLFYFSVLPKWVAFSVVHFCFVAVGVTNEQKLHLGLCLLFYIKKKGGYTSFSSGRSVIPIVGGFLRQQRRLTDDENPVCAAGPSSD